MLLLVNRWVGFKQTEEWVIWVEVFIPKRLALLSALTYLFLFGVSDKFCERDKVAKITQFMAIKLLRP